MSADLARRGGREAASDARAPTPAAWPPHCRRHHHLTAPATDAAAYALISLAHIAAFNTTTGTAALAYCAACTALFATAAHSVLSGRLSPAARARLAAALAVLLAGVNNSILALSQGFRHGVPAAVGAHPWPAFWTSRFGPVLVFLLNLAVAWPAGPRLAAVLGAQAVVAAATTPAGCKSVLAYRALQPLFSRVVDLWGGAARAAAAPDLPPADAAACARHACVQVTLALYALVAALSWAVAPRGSGRGRLGVAAVVAGVSVATWAGLPRLNPRPAGCAGAAAAATWHYLERWDAGVI